MNENAYGDPDAKAKAAFAKLRPVCVEVMRAPSLEALRTLREAVCRLDSIHPHLVEYVALPLRMIIRRSGSPNLRMLEATLEALAAIFSRVKAVSLESWEIFEELYGFACMLLDPKLSSQAGYPSLSEDLLLSAVRALRALLLSLDDSGLARLHSRLPLLGHGVSVLLDVVGSQPAKALRAGAIGALLALSGKDSDNMAEVAGLTHSDSATAADPAHCLRAVVECVGVGGSGGSFASFLPGIAMALCKLVTMDTKVGQMALLAWAHFVSMVMADRDADVTRDFPSASHGNLQPPTTHVPSPPSTQEQQRKSLLRERTAEWRVETDAKLSILVQKMTSPVTRDSWRVRLALVLWAHCLLAHCHRTLVTCVPAVLEVLVTLTHDDYPRVSSAARQAVELFSQEYAREGSRQLTSVLEERLHALASALPRLMRQHDDARKLSTLQLLAGYLRLLGPRVISLVHSHPHLSRITQALLQTLTLEVGDTRIIEQPVLEEGEREREGEGEGWRLPLRYHHFRSERIETLLHHACQLLGFYGSLPVLLDHLLDLFRGSAHYRKEVAIVIENVLVGAAGWGCAKGRGEPPHSVPPEQLFSLCESVVVEMAAPGVWRGEEGRAAGSTHPQEPTLLSCLLLAAITTVVKVMGQAFDRLLQLAVYPLMQQLGHSSAAVSSHALGTLRTVCSHCGYSSLEQLITRNADYLVNHVSLQLRTGPAQHPEALLVLQAMLRYGEEAVLPLIQDSVEELFLSLDLREDPALLWPALRTLALATTRWTAASEMPASSAVASPTGSPEETMERPHPHEERLRPSQDEVRRFFLEYHQRKERERLIGLEDEEQGPDAAEEVEENSAKPRPLPAHQLAMEVLQRCTHYLASPAPDLRLTVLDTLGHCLSSLRVNETALLPEVHKVWPAFLHRLSDSTPSVAVRAWGVLLVMVEVCREFLRRRVVKEVWPRLIGRLESLATKSANSDKLYRQTANFKLQRKLLECVGTLCEHLDIRSSDEEHLAHACVPYLSSEQPGELRKTCQTSLTTLVRRDPDRMWLLLQQLRSQDVPTPPHQSLKPYKFSAFPSSGKFTDCANALLEHC